MNNFKEKLNLKRFLQKKIYFLYKLQEYIAKFLKNAFKNDFS